MGKLTVRLAKPGDAGMLLAIYAPYVIDSPATWEYDVPGRAEFTARLDRCMREGFPWLVAEEDGALLGYAYAGRFGERRGFDWDVQVAIYLTPDAHRRHIGTALYTALLNLLHQQGYCNCYALVTSENEASCAFHASCGFTEAAHLPNAGFKHGQWLGLTYYFLNLRPCVAQPAAPISFYEIDPQRREQILYRSSALAHPAQPWAKQP
jgi:phosphinothricin acetyltransferase